MRPIKRKKRSHKVFMRSSRFVLKLSLILLLAVLLIWGWRNFFESHSKIVPAEGGVFTESLIGSTKNLNPLAEDITSFDRDIHKLIFAGLLVYNPSTGQLEDGLANLQIDTDGKKYNLTLKDSAYFSDGEKVTMDDVKFTYDQILKNPDFPNKNLTEAFKYVTIEELDEKTISFSLPEKNVFFTFF